MTKNSERDMKQPRKCIVYFLPILITSVLAGCGSANPKATIAPTQIAPPQEWTEIYPGMSPAELSNVMGDLARRQYTEALDGQARVTVTYPPFTEFVFVNPQKPSTLVPNEVAIMSGELVLSNRLQRCSYSQGENGAFEASFPLSKERAKELFINSAAPLGFIAKHVPDEYSTLSRTRDRNFPNLEMEALLTARFSEDTTGTAVYVNTESTEIVFKSRDKSYAKSILMHMHCTHSLYEKNYGSTASITEPAKDESKAVQLVNYRMVSSRVASIGDPVEFKIVDNSVTGGSTFRKGGSAWGVVADIRHTQPTGDVLTIRLDRIQAANGQWYAMKNENGSENVTWQSHKTVQQQPPGTIISGRTITVGGPSGIPDTYLPTHSIFHIGETINVVVGEPVNL